MSAKPEVEINAEYELDDSDSDSSNELGDESEESELDENLVRNLEILFKMRRDAPEIDPVTGKTKLELWGEGMWFPHFSLKDIIEGNFNKNMAEPINTPSLSPDSDFTDTADSQQTTVIPAKHLSCKSHELLNANQIYAFSQTDPVNFISATPKWDREIQTDVQMVCCDPAHLQLDEQIKELKLENQRLKEELSRMEYSARLGFRLNPERSTSAVDSLMSTTDTEVACIFSGQGRPKKKLFRHCVIGPGDSDEVISADHAAVVSSPIEPLSEKKKFHKPKFMHESVLTADNGDSIPAVGNEFNENIISNHGVLLLGEKNSEPKLTPSNNAAYSNNSKSRTHGPRQFVNSNCHKKRRNGANFSLKMSPETDGTGVGPK